MRRESSGRPRVCVAVADHWSYIGVGWSLGIESSAESLRDAFALADSDVAAKTSVNLDAYAYELLAQEYPEVARRLSESLERGALDVVGASFGQPLGSTVSGESNLRQLVEGRRTVAAALGFEVETFLEQEEFSHPQVPQLLAGAGYRSASLAQSDTWGRQGVPSLDVPVVDWVGADGTAIRATTRNGLCFHTWAVDWAEVLASDAFATLSADGVPLIVKWEEFGWGNEEIADAGGLARSLGRLAELADVRFVTLGEYLDGWDGPVPAIRFVGDDWRRLLAWGVGGDQLRRAERATEAALLDAEALDAFAHARGGESAHAELHAAWRELLAAQSHDAALCEYTVSVYGPTPLNPRDDRFNASWGSVAFDKLRAARSVARRVADAAAARLVEPAGDAVTVFNPAGHARAELVESPPLRELPAGTRGIVVLDPEGVAVPSQAIEAHRRPDGSLASARVLFRAEVGPLGAATYALRPRAQEAGDADDAAPSGTVGAAATGLTVSDDGLRLANGLVAVELDPAHGGIARLADAQGRDLLGPASSPSFTGERNPDFPLTGVFHRLDPADMEHLPAGARLGGTAGPHRYDSLDHRARIDILERGPARVVVRAVTQLELLRFETYVALAAGAPHVDLRVRVVAQVPPDPSISVGPGEKWVPVRQEADGYWLRFATAFAPERVVRDLPFLVEPTGRDAFEALGFVDLVGADRALLVAHGGTQHFRRESGTVLANLVMREWESYFNNRYGWPPVADYDYRLIPHAPGWTDLERRRAAAALQRPLPVVPGALPDGRARFGHVAGAAELSSVRVAADGCLEARAAEYDGAAGPFALALDGAGAFEETDHRGDALGAGPVKLRAHGVHTLRAELS